MLHESINQPLGPVDFGQPHTLLVVAKQPCDLPWVRRVTLPVGEHVIQGDIRMYLADPYCRRLQAAGVLTATFVDRSIDQPVQVVDGQIELQVPAELIAAPQDAPPSVIVDVPVIPSFSVPTTDNQAQTPNDVVLQVVDQPLATVVTATELVVGEQLTGENAVITSIDSVPVVEPEPVAPQMPSTESPAPATMDSPVPTEVEPVSTTVVAPAQPEPVPTEAAPVPTVEPVIRRRQISGNS